MKQLNKFSTSYTFQTEGDIFIWTHRLAKRNYHIQRWKAIIQDRIRSNLTVDEYCNQNGLSRHAYFYWLRIIREEALAQSDASGFVELRLPTEANEQDCAVAVEQSNQPEPAQLTLLIGDISIQVTERTSAELLAKTIGVIRSAQ